MMIGTLQPPYHPVEVTDAQIAFPAGASALYPPVSEFSRETVPLVWEKFAQRLFFGAPASRIVVRDGIDHNMAVRHLAVVMRTREPKHEYKIVSMAFLMNLWFVDVLDEEKFTANVLESLVFPAPRVKFSVCGTALEAVNE